MKHFWRNWLAIAALACLSNSAAGQQNWNQPSDIGSYQSIVSRAGVGNGTYDHGAVQQPVYPNGSPVVSQPEPFPHPVHNPPLAGQSAGIGPQSSTCGSGCDSGWGQGGNGFATGCGDYFDPGIGGVGSAANWVLGTRALFFNRTGETAVPLTRNATDVLLSTDNAYGLMPGTEVSLGRRTCAGNGLEIRYWGLYPSQRETTIFGPGLDSYLVGFANYEIGPGANNVLDYYNNADSNRIYRQNEFHNVEINALRNVGTYTTRGGRNGSFEVLGGFRWLYFNEDYRFAAFNGAVSPMQVNYDLNTRNNLLGFQLGGRNEVCLTDRISLLSGVNFGLFNNNIRSFQSINNEFGAWATPAPGVTDVGDYAYQSRKNDLAAIGEVDLGMAYQFAQRARIVAGYRIIGISGVALAPTQIPRNFANAAEIQRINSRDSLILGGAFAGLDFCF